MVRRFTAEPVNDNVLQTILNAGLRAPSAGHTQAVEFVALTDAAVADFWQLTAAGRTSSWLDGLRTAPALVQVWTSETAYRDRYAESDKAAELVAPWWWVDAGMAVEAMLLAAVDASLGACFFGLPPGREDDVRAHYALRDDLRAVGVVALGRPHPDARPGRSAARPRRADRVHLVRDPQGKDSQQNFG